ncbi:L-alanine-DL-glutamate epimerase-like enolase superfamily enzyme [Rhodoligotrophos appendicifer]|uniref:mandelate racemase/muconate lactonizing enzyme family protein n=1 Tax=Rhodoligotrophos appendicifer TaxID=987056 RepID=UPI0011856D41|nr:mandelate racemase/muconate lactonizing enzyme family protein [Rhodoligotrophos appendicifer]
MSASCTRITGLRLRPASFPLDPPFQAAVGLIASTDLLLVELQTESGLTGIAYTFSFGARDIRMIDAAARALGEVVIGLDVLDTEKLWRRMWDSLLFVGRGGPALSAMGAIDIAAWDLKGKTAGLPVHRLLGGARSRIPAYGSGGSLGQSADRLAAEMAGYVEAGFSAVKLKLGPSMVDNADRLTRVRNAVGEDVPIYGDGNQQWTPKQAIRAAHSLEAFNLGWFEEPIASDDLDGLAEVRRALAVPVATGETNFGVSDFAHALKTGAADILMPNLQRVGGVTPWLRIAQAAALANVPIASHVFTEINASLMCAIPNAMTLEVVPWWPNPFEQQIAIADGHATPPDGPGFGLSFNEDRLRHFTQ